MSQPTYHLESFEGPLDLLLSLVTKNKVSIFDIPITLILDQYLQYLEGMKQADMAVTAEFVAMAAHLTYVKSRMLLPALEPVEEEDPRAGLVEALLEYKRIKDASLHLAVMGEIGRDIFIKMPEQVERDRSFVGEIPMEKLVKAMRDIFERGERKLPPPIEAFTGIVGHETATISDKIDIMISCFLKQDSVTLEELIWQSRTKYDAVAMFLAVLELSKAKKIWIDECQGQYIIRLHKEDTEEEDDAS